MGERGRNFEEDKERKREGKTKMWESKKVRGEEEGELERAETGKFRENESEKSGRKERKTGSKMDTERGGMRGYEREKSGTVAMKRNEKEDAGERRERARKREKREVGRNGEKVWGGIVEVRIVEARDEIEREERR